MVSPDDVAEWIGKHVIVDWNISFGDGEPKGRTNSAGRVLRVDDTYLYVQPLRPSSTQKIEHGAPVLRLGLRDEEERIPLVDIDRIHSGPLVGIEIDE